MKHVVMFSGGVGSWAAAKRVVAEHGAADVTLLFADTLIEDEDLYRFLDEAAANVGAPLVRVADGRTPWELFNERNFISNSRIAHCSEVLKQATSRRWLRENCDPHDTMIYLGIDWSEEHRYHRAAKHWKPWEVKAPLCEPPYVDKDDLFAALDEAGIPVPRLYHMGFPHNNCGGFCVRAGHAHFKRLLEKMPERFAYHENQEEAMRARLARDVAILRDRREGTSKPLPLRVLRERVEAQQTIDEFDWGGCGCFLDDSDQDEEV